jgi:putative tryptophan/tyrosine transport system substrate-binding protein
MRRRQFVCGAGASLLVGGARAQPSPARVPRVGILTAARPEQRPTPLSAFLSGLLELGYTDGRNIVLEFRFAAGDYSVFPRLAAELVNLPVDVIVVDGGSAVGPAMAATKTTPIVIATAGDPVALGFVTSLGRPGGNVTGFSLVSIELNLKRLDILKQALPTARAVTVVFNSQNATAVAGTQAVVEATGKMGIKGNLLELPTVEAIRKAKPEDLDNAAPALVIPDAMFWNNRALLMELLASKKVPAVYPEREYADDGGMMAYGPNVPDNFRRAAGYVDRILKGANPGELPIQQPSRFDFVVNLRAARALGVELPQALLSSADEVIE